MPYSSSYSAEFVSRGSRPGLRTGTKPAPSAVASGAPTMKPRASGATTSAALLPPRASSASTAS